MKQLRFITLLILVIICSGCASTKPNEFMLPYTPPYSRPVRPNDVVTECPDGHNTIVVTEGVSHGSVFETTVDGKTVPSLGTYDHFFCTTCKFQYKDYKKVKPFPFWEKIHPELPRRTKTMLSSFCKGLLLAPYDPDEGKYAHFSCSEYVSINGGLVEETFLFCSDNMLILTSLIMKHIEKKGYSNRIRLVMTGKGWDNYEREAFGWKKDAEHPWEANCYILGCLSDDTSFYITINTSMGGLRMVNIAIGKTEALRHYCEVISRDWERKVVIEEMFDGEYFLDYF